MGVFSALGILRGPKPSAEPPAESLEQVTRSVDADRGLIARAISEVYEDAKARGELPTLTDILVHATTLSEGRLSPHAIASNLRGQILDEFLISDAQAEQGMGQGLLDLKSDGLADKFYANLNFDNARMDGCTFDGPKLYGLARGAHISNARFINMGKDDVVTLGDCSNVSFGKSFGGTIEIAPKAQVNGLDLSGTEVKLHIGEQAHITKLKTDDRTNIVELTAEPGAQVTDAKFSPGCTVSMASKLEGTIWRNVEFDQANLKYVEFDKAYLTNVTFNKCDISGLNFPGATVDNLHFVGIPPADIMKALEGAKIGPGITVNGVEITSDRKNDYSITEELIAMIQGEQASKQLQAAVRGLGQPAHQPDHSLEQNYAAFSLGDGGAQARLAEVSAPDLSKVSTGPAQESGRFLA